MNIDLPHALQRYVDNQVESGRYLDAGDVVRAVLRRVQAQDDPLSYSNLSFGDGDLMSLVQMVMMQCAKSNSDVLRDIMDELNRSRERECRRNNIDDAKETRHDGLDSMSDMSQLFQMRLQKYLDTYTKMFEMLSNVLKRIGETKDAIAQNIK